MFQGFAEYQAQSGQDAGSSFRACCDTMTNTGLVFWPESKTATQQSDATYRDLLSKPLIGIEGGVPQSAVGRQVDALCLAIRQAWRRWFVGRGNPQAIDYPEKSRGAVSWQWTGNCDCAASGARERCGKRIPEQCNLRSRLRHRCVRGGAGCGRKYLGTATAAVSLAGGTGDQGLARRVRGSGRTRP